MPLGDQFNKAKQEAEEFNQELAFIADAIRSIGGDIEDDLIRKLEAAGEGAKGIGDALKKGYNKDVKNASKLVEDIVKAQGRQEAGLLRQSEIGKLQAKIEDLKALKAFRFNQAKAYTLDLEEKNLEAMEAEIKAAEKALEVIKTNKNKFGGVAAFASEKFKQLNLNIKDVGAAIFTFMVKKLGEFDTEVANIQNNFDLAKGEAIRLNEELAKTALSARTLGVNIETVTAATNALNKELGGTTNIFTKEIRNEVAYLSSRLGLSVEEAAKLEAGLIANGREAGTIASNAEAAKKEIKASTGVSLSFRAILKDAADVSGAMLVNLEATPGALEKSVAQAKALGVQLDDIKNIQSSILDFESSIAAEIEAEVLLGKELNLDRARAAAMANDYIGLTEEIASQFGSIEEFQKMGYFQQEAFAKSLGLSKDRLGEILRTSGAINNSLETGVETQEGSAEEGANALSAQQALTESINSLNSILKTSLGLMLGLAAAAAIVAAPFTGGLSLGAMAGILTAGGALGAGIGMAVSDGIAPAERGPFTVTDSYGATAVTAKGDGVVVSPNISQGGGGEGITKSQANEMISLLKIVANKDFSVNMDGRKLSSAIQTSGVSYNI